MARGLILLFCLVIDGLLASGAQADTVYLKNGRKMEGIITEETADYIQLAVGVGHVKFYMAQIERIERSSREENQQRAEGWQRQHERKEREQRRLAQQASGSAVVEVQMTRQKKQFFVNALLNGETNVKLNVDTGSTLVVLSYETALKMGLDAATAKPDIKMLLANGREVPAKLLKLGSVDIEGAKAQNVEAAVILVRGAFNGFDGLLGMSYLNKFTFQIDPEAGLLTLEKNKEGAGSE